MSLILWIKLLLLLLAEIKKSYTSKILFLDRKWDFKAYIYAKKPTNYYWLMVIQVEKGSKQQYLQV